MVSAVVLITTAFSIIFSRLTTSTRADWLEAELRPTLIQIIARVTSLIFVGPELSRDPAWLDITVTYFAKSNAVLKEHRL